MSASSKKKLRKEQNAAELTEKQRQEKSESKKVKAYTIAFVAVISIMVVAAIAIGSVTLINRSGLLEKKTTAATIDGLDLNSVEMNYYFLDAVKQEYDQWVKQFGNATPMYMQLMGLDLSKPLNQQPYAEGDTTWADYYFDTALERAKSDYALCKKAQEAGFTLPEEDAKLLDQNIEDMKNYTSLRFKSFDEFLSLNYCAGANEQSYREYLERSALASAYFNATSDSFTYEDADLRAFEEGSYNTYSSYSYATYNVNVSSFLEGGTKDEEGNTTYSDEEKAAAAAKAKEVADSLTSAKTVEEFDAAIAALEMNAENANASSAKSKDVLYSIINESMQEWLSDENRKEGDITSIANETTSKDADGNEVKTVNGYSVVMFQGRNDNLNPLANVRHILVAFEGGTPDQNGSVTYSEEEKAKAKSEAEDLLKQWQSGTADEESFAALVKEKTDDKASAETGGLFENISRDSQYVENFLNWAIDETRESGDSGIVESPYGYHVMYYVGDSALTYRDYMVENALRAKDLQQWHDALLEPITASKGNTTRVKMDFVLQPVL